MLDSALAQPAATAVVPPPLMAPWAPPDAPTYGLRRPLVGRDGAVAGFELLLPASALRRLAGRDDAAALVAHQVALMAAGTQLAAAGRAPLLRLPATALARPAVQAAAVAGMMLWVDALADVPAEVTAALRRRGVRLGSGDGPPSARPEVDFVVLQCGPGDLDTLLLSAQRWRDRWPRLTVVALGLEHLENVERALRGGVSLAAGPLGISTTAPAPRELGSAAHRICRLLNQLTLDSDTAIVAEAVRADVALTYRLLRYVNSPAIGLSQAVEAVEQAVAVLGRAELYRWLTMQLMSAAVVRQASLALQESALARGRLLELIARARGDADPGAFFTLGLMSLIELLLQLPIATAIEPLRLGDPARQALLHRRGPWGDRLVLMEAIDLGDAERTEALATSLGVRGELPSLLGQAWDWAVHVSEPSPESAVA